MKKLGFTLAEVLITLVIIGVIAAMTVPTLMNNTQGQENKTAFKKAISSMNQALTLEYALEGNTAASMNIVEIMQGRTNVINTSATWSATDGTQAKTSTIATADGIIYSFPATKKESGGCPGETGLSQTTYPTDTCGTGLVDVNGVKGPGVKLTAANVAKPTDIFEFTIYETKVLPGTSPQSPEAAVMYDAKTVSGGTTN